MGSKTSDHGEGLSPVMEGGKEGRKDIDCSTVQGDFCKAYKEPLRQSPPSDEHYASHVVL